VTVRRSLLVVALLIAAVSTVFAVRPFQGPGTESLDPPIPDTPFATGAIAIHESAVQGSGSDCGSSVVDAWHSKSIRWKVRTNPATDGAANFTAILSGSTCRTAAQRRVRRAAFGLAAAVVIGAFALLFRRRRGEDPARSPGS
jgi:hypothetical protein